MGAFGGGGSTRNTDHVFSNDNSAETFPAIVVNYPCLLSR